MGFASTLSNKLRSMGTWGFLIALLLFLALGILNTLIGGVLYDFFA